MLSLEYFKYQLSRLLACAVFILFPLSAIAQNSAFPYIFLGNYNIPPMIYLQDSKPAGLVIDLTNALAEKGELDIKVETMEWGKAQEIVSKGQADALLQINKNKEREKIYDFSKPLLESHFCIFRNDSRVEIRDIRSLFDKTVGVEAKGYPLALLRKYPQIKIKTISSWKKGFDLINDKQIDAVIVDRWVGEYELMTHGIKGITAVDQPVEISYSHIAVKKGNRSLLERINEGLKRIREDGTYNKILNQWREKEVVYMSKEQYDHYRRSLKQAVVDADRLLRVSLTPEEQAWLSAHPTASMCVDPHWMPFEQINEAGEYEGMVADYMALISNRLGITFELYPTGNYKESLSNLASGNCMILSSGDSDEETIRQGLATKAYLNSPRVFAVHQDTPFVSGFHEIVDRRIGVVAAYPIQQELLKLYPNINLVLVENQDAGVHKVASGEIDAFVSTLGGISHSIQHNSLSNVKIGGVYPGEAPIAILVNENETALSPILNKAIDSITSQERKRIADRWISVNYERGFDYGLLWKILAAILLFFAAFLFWNFSLKRTVALRTNELRQSEANLNQAQAVANVGSWDLDIPNNVLRWSDETYHLFGVPKDTSLTYEKFLEYLHPEDKDSVDKAWKDALNGTPYDIEHRIVVNGSIKWVRAKFELEFDEKKNPLRGIGVVQDITRRKRIEEALYFVAQRGWSISNKEFFQSLVTYLAESFGIQYAFVDQLTDHNTALTVALYAGGEIAENIEYPLKHTPCDNVVGKSLCSYPQNICQLFPDDQLLVDMNAEGYIGIPLWDSQNKAIGLIALMDTEPLKEIKLMESVLQIVAKRASAELERNRSHEEIIGYRDHLEELVTNRTEELTKAKETADTANRAKSVFLANMSHELRTPLNAILGFSEMIGRDHGTPEPIQEKVAIINSSGEHLLSMINDVLDLSKIEAGRMELETEAIDLPLMLQDIGRMFEVRAERAELDFNLKIDPTLSHYIKIDAGKLRQILINVLANAVNFTNEGGFSLCARTQPIKGNPTMVTLQLEVNDSGPGIAPEYLNRIFQPFVQAPHSMTNNKGTGLGLAITKSFVDLMGGKISIESTVGKGSLFCIDLPVALAEATEVGIIDVTSQVVLGLEPGQTAWRILVVEDNRENRLLLSSQLLQVGFQVREAENGEQGVTLFEEWHPHFIWMDMRMPVMNGYQATAKIRSLPGGDTVKIVAITASAFKEQRKAILDAGCDDVVHKPFQKQKIFEILKAQLGVMFIYEEKEFRRKAQNLQKISGPLVPPPGEEMAILYKLAKIGSMRDIEKQTAHIASLGELYVPFASKLRRLANDFEEKAILQMVEKYLEEGQDKTTDQKKTEMSNN